MNDTRDELNEQLPDEKDEQVPGEPEKKGEDGLAVARHAASSIADALRNRYMKEVRITFV